MEVLAITSTRLYVFAELLPIINLFDRNTIKPEIYSHIIAKYLSQEQKNNHGGENFYKGIEI
jgi:hypothetical protein